MHITLAIGRMIARRPRQVTALILPMDAVAGETRRLKVYPTLQRRTVAIGAVAGRSRGRIGMRNILDHPGVQAQGGKLRRPRRRLLAAASSLHATKEGCNEQRPDWHETS